jgi:ribosomal protein L37AE/L43A
MSVPSHLASMPDRIVCPRCGAGELRPRELHLDIAGCASCGFAAEGAFLRTLEQIAALPEALGAHACECGHPEMRHLPDGVFHCPACGSEVMPLRARKSSPGISIQSQGSSAPPLLGDANDSYRLGLDPVFPAAS